MNVPLLLAIIDQELGDDMVAPLIRRSLEAYGSGAMPHVGSFLTAVLENDLETAVATADPYNLHTLRPVLRYVAEVVPAEAWGSRDRVRAWQAKHGPHDLECRGAQTPPWEFCCERARQRAEARARATRVELPNPAGRGGR
jgi:hypothetical protein